jgi:hypothetical protein
MTQNSIDAEHLLTALTQAQPIAGVTVMPRSGNEIPHPNCLVVEPYRDTARGGELLASVEHYQEVENPTGFPWKILPINREPMAFKRAMELAMAYAKRQNVPVILVNHDGLSSADERQQTDTVVLNVKAPRTAT